MQTCWLDEKENKENNLQLKRNAKRYLKIQNICLHFSPLSCFKDKVKDDDEGEDDDEWKHGNEMQYKMFTKYIL